jgi:hypothetical protein
MTARPLPAIARCRAALRRWLRHTWISRLPLLDWFRGRHDRSRGAGRANGRGRQRVPEGMPRPRISLDLLLLENRFSPDDVMGLGLSVLGMPLSTPGMIFLQGWSSGWPREQVPVAVVPERGSRTGLGGGLSAEQLAALTADWTPTASTRAGSMGELERSPAPAVVAGEGRTGKLAGAPGDEPFRDPLGDGLFSNRAGGATGTGSGLSELQRKMDVDLLTPPKGGGGLPPYSPGNLMGSPFTASAPPAGNSTRPAGVSPLPAISVQQGIQLGGAVNGATPTPITPATAAAQSSGASPATTPAGNYSLLEPGTRTINTLFQSGGYPPPLAPPPPGSGSGLTEYTVPTPNSKPTDITSGPDGNLWFTEQGSFYIPVAPGQIGRVTTAGSFAEYLVPNQGYPGTISSGPDGNLWFNEANVNPPPQPWLGRITTAGSFTQYLGNSKGAAESNLVQGQGGDGFWLAENITDPSTGLAAAIAHVDTSGNVSVTPTPSVGAYGSTLWMAAGPDGNFWVSGGGINKIGGGAVRLLLCRGPGSHPTC